MPAGTAVAPATSPPQRMPALLVLRLLRLFLLLRRLLRMVLLLRRLLLLLRLLLLMKSLWGLCFWIASVVVLLLPPLLQHEDVRVAP